MFRAGIVGCALLVAVGTGASARRGRIAGRTRRLSRQHHHGLRQLPYAARCRRQTDRRQGACRAGSPSIRRPSSPPRRTSRRTGKPESEAGATPRSSARWSRAYAPIMAASPACRWPRSCRPISTRRCCLKISTPSSPICAASRRSAIRSPIPSTRSPVRRDPYPDAEAGFSEAMLADPVRRGAYLVTIGHCMDATPPGRAACPISRQASARGGRMFPAREGSPEGTPPTSSPTSRRIRPRASAAGATPKSSAPSRRASRRDGRRLKPPMAYGYYAGLRDGRSCRYRRLSAHRAAAAMTPLEQLAPSARPMRRAASMPHLASTWLRPRNFPKRRRQPLPNARGRPPGHPAAALGVVAALLLPPMWSGRRSTRSGATGACADLGQCRRALPAAVRKSNETI